MDLIRLVLLLFAVALLASLLSRMSPVAWLRREWQLMRMRSWARPREISGPGTLDDPRVQNMVIKQRALGKRMRKQGRTLLSGKHYIPALTKPGDAPPPKADKVVPIRKPQSKGIA